MHRFFDGWCGSNRRRYRRGGLGRFHQARWRERGGCRLWRFRFFRAGRWLLRARLGRRALGEHVATRQRDAAVAREALDELARHDFLDCARGAFQLDAVSALQQREHFLAACVEKLGDSVNTNSGQIVLPYRTWQVAQLKLRPTPFRGSALRLSFPSRCSIPVVRARLQSPLAMRSLLPVTSLREPLPESAPRSSRRCPALRTARRHRPGQSSRRCRIPPRSISSWSCR